MSKSDILVAMGPKAFQQLNTDKTDKRGQAMSIEEKYGHIGTHRPNRPTKVEMVKVIICHHLVHLLVLTGAGLPSIMFWEEVLKRIIQAQSGPVG